MNIQLKKFNIKSISQDKVIVLIGKRETGKSFLVKDLLYNNRNIPVGVTISGTEASNHFYSGIMPSIFIHDEYTPQIVHNVIRRQKHIKKKINNQIDQSGTSIINPNSFLILDDCMDDDSWTKDKNIKTCFLNGRHWNIMFIITMQFSLGIPPKLRTNIDYIFILRENIVSNRKRLYEHYAGMFPTFETFCQVMDQCTENYECLVINNNSKSNKLEDQVFWYKAEPHPPFKLGSSALWKHHDKYYHEYDSDEEDELHIKKKNHPKINVKKL